MTPGGNSILLDIFPDSPESRCDRVGHEKLVICFETLFGTVSIGEQSPIGISLAPLDHSPAIDCPHPRLEPVRTHY